MADEDLSMTTPSPAGSPQIGASPQAQPDAARDAARDTARDAASSPAVPSPASSSRSESPAADGSSAAELDVDARLASLCALDSQITQILDKAARVTSAIKDGKLPGDAAATRQNFQAALEEYNRLVEEVNGRLRREVKLLHDASHTQLLPLYIPVQAAAFGREKEDMLFESLSRLPK